MRVVEKIFTGRWAEQGNETCLNADQAVQRQSLDLLASDICIVAKPREYRKI